MPAAPPVADDPASGSAPAAPAGAPPGASVASAPDWEAFTGEVQCPLCSYNLRGLTEPRCPECGYASTWTELLDVEQRRHPYLFEHQDGRRARSFFRTLVGGLRPARFWKSLHANHQVYLGRLLAYWALTATIALASGFGIRYVVDGFELWRDNESGRRFVMASSARPVGARYVQQGIQTYGSLAAYLDVEFPLPPARRFFNEVIARSGLAVPLKLTVLVVLWPVATFAALMIFVASMRRARVRRVHVLRCAVYSGDVAAWLAVPWLATLLVRGDIHGRREMMTALVVALVLWAVASYRLLAAYRHYLRFDHAAGVVLATQVIVGLAAACLLIKDLVWLF